MTGYLELLGGGGAIVAAIWLWRLQTVTRFIKFLSIGAVILGGLSIVGIVSISVDAGAALELGRTLLDLAGEVWGWIA